jgi:hypothetical protein
MDGAPSIAFDATSSAATSSGTSLTFSHTTSGADRILLVGISEVEAGGAPDYITGVTYNGVSMTRVNTAVPASANWRGYIYALVNPASGTHNVVVSASQATYIIAIGASYTGVSQGSQPDVNTANTCPNFSTTCSVSVAPVNDGSWVIGLSNNSNGHDMTAGSGTSLRYGYTGYGTALFESTANPITPAATTTLNVSDAVGFGAFVTLGVSISPAAL